jgi:hypothetical protein
MSTNHYWKSPDEKIFMITTPVNTAPGEGWVEIDYEEYAKGTGLEIPKLVEEIKEEIKNE